MSPGETDAGPVEAALSGKIRVCTAVAILVLAVVFVVVSALTEFEILLLDSAAQTQGPRNSSTSMVDGLQGNVTVERLETNELLPPPKLRFSWRNMSLHSELARRIYDLQHNCSLDPRVSKFRKSIKRGLGAELHVWGVKLLRAVSVADPSKRQRLRSQPVDTKLKFQWADQVHCSPTESAWGCYFEALEPSCPNEIVQPPNRSSPWEGFNRWTPPGVSTEYARAATTEFFFSSMTPLVVEEAERQLHMIFPNGPVPDLLVCVHIRWGDKFIEMDLVSIETYIQAVHSLLEERRTRLKATTANAPVDDLDVHILLCTEDPAAAEAFRSNAPQHWIIHMDPFYTLFEPYRVKRNSTAEVVGEISHELQGQPGLWAIASLLVAMEANDFVLTTKSNWSRLLNELRKSIVDPRCNNCTRMIDLREGEC